MREYLLISFLLLSTFLYSQEPNIIGEGYSLGQYIIKNSLLPKSVLSPAGSSAKTDGVAINWTLGSTLFLASTSDNSTLMKTDFLSNSDIAIFPNPVIDKLTIQFKGKDIDPSSTSLELFDLNLKRLLEIKAIKSNTEIDLSTLPTATYILKLFNIKNQDVKEFKIIKN